MISFYLYLSIISDYSYTSFLSIFLVSSSLPIIPVFVGIAMFFNRFMFILGLIVVTLIAFFESLPSPLLLLLLLRIFLSIFKCFFYFLFSLSCFLQNIFNLFCLLLRFGWCSWRIIIDTFILRLIYIIIPHFLSIHSMVAMQVLDVLQVTGIANQTSFTFTLTLIRRLLFKEKRPLVVIGNIIIVIIIFPFIIFIAEVGIELTIVVLTSHSLGH